MFKNPYFACIVDVKMPVNYVDSKKYKLEEKLDNITLIFQELQTWFNHRLDKGS